ncbi:MAG: hypothetical protein V1886_01435 [archaeon]
MGWNDKKGEADSPFPDDDSYQDVQKRFVYILDRKYRDKYEIILKQGNLEKRIQGK